jgi:NADH dehydrogenase/NADH:ubiquinone oxidoreductase subunit G
VIDLCPVGALTSKPYAFSARPWELNSVNSIDLTDAIGSNIRLDSRGNDLLRILPRLNENINEEWITDKARFCLDGLNNQRLLKPIVKINGELKEIRLKQSIIYFYELLKQSIGSKNSVKFDIGKTVDLETLIFTEKFCDRLPNIYNKKSILSSSSLANFGFNSNFNDLENSDLCLLIGTNPRTEGTLINTRLRKGTIKGNLDVYYVGPSMDLTYKATQLRNNYR